MPRFGSGRVVFAADASQERGRGERGSPPLCLFSPILLSAGSARIEGWSSRSVRGLAGRAGEEGEQGAGPGCRGTARADPALGPSSPTRVPGDRDHRSPQPPPHLRPILCAGSRFVGRLLYAAGVPQSGRRGFSEFSSDSAAPLF
ncbi:hypothetical protein NDU88_003491 [Pleurodeles waltl]|uniref:Uncharacterized protein n=1 Tax=Pleurodeles waltl TaxID=8319 RepID=A0AAV7KX53_PLEWA|nr:hypothetical protein NDU88_003491 [Pleurodeles waltl]